MRRLLAAGLFMFVSTSVLMADQFMGQVTKVEEGKVTLTKFEKANPEGIKKTHGIVMKVDPNVKVVYAKKDPRTQRVYPGRAGSWRLEQRDV